MLNFRLPRFQRARQARTSIALASALLGAGSALSCSRDPAGLGDGGGAGDRTDEPVLAVLQVSPTVADLCAADNRLQLTIGALDQNQVVIPIGAGTVRYSSSASEIAVVSSSGLVTAGEPGTAIITAEFTWGGITRTASMNATVHETPSEYPAIAGVYDVDAVIVRSLWGPAGTRETSIITIQHSRDTPLFAGTFEDFRLFDPGFEAGPFSGSISGSFDCAGRVVFQLRMEGLQSALWHAEGAVDAQQITGHFWDPGSALGTFTATRRAAE